MVSSFSVRVFPLVIGALLLLTGLSSITRLSFITGLVLLAIGALLVLDALVLKLTIEKSGTSTTIKIPYYENSKITGVVDAIHQALANDTDKTDSGLYFDKK